MTEINWTEVRAARRRGKLGTMRPGDQELVAAAMKANPARYRELSAEVVAEVIAEIRDPFGSRGDR